VNLEEIIESLRAELVDATNEVASLRQERTGINDRIRARLIDIRRLTRMTRAAEHTKKLRRG
jgi:hypothetical protein